MKEKLERSKEDVWKDLRNLGIVAFIFLSLCFCGKKVQAEEAGGKKEVKTFSASGKLGVSAPYIDEYTGEHISKSTVTQPGATLEHNSSGVYVSMVGFIAHENEEVDLYLGKSTGWKGMTLDTGVGFYNSKKFDSVDNEDLFSAFVGVDFPKMMGGVTPFIYVEGNIPFKKELAEGGVLWKTGVKKSVKVAKQPIDFKIEAGGNDGIYGSKPKPISFARGTASTEIKILGLKLSPSLALQKGFGGIAGNGWQAIAGLTFLF